MRGLRAAVVEEIRGWRALVREKGLVRVMRNVAWWVVTGEHHADAGPKKEGRHG